MERIETAAIIRIRVCTFGGDHLPGAEKRFRFLQKYVWAYAFGTVVL